MRSVERPAQALFDARHDAALLWPREIGDFQCFQAPLRNVTKADRSVRLADHLVEDAVDSEHEELLFVDSVR